VRILVTTITRNELRLFVKDEWILFLC